MITHQAITEFLSRLPANASRDGGIKEDMYDMLVGARNALQQNSVLPPPQYAIYGADRNDAYAKGFCGGVEATVEFNRDTKEQS